MNITATPSIPIIISPEMCLSRATSPQISPIIAMGIITPLRKLPPKACVEVISFSYLDI